MADEHEDRAKGGLSQVALKKDLVQISAIAHSVRGTSAGTQLPTPVVTYSMLGEAIRIVEVKNLQDPVLKRALIAQLLLHGAEELAFEDDIKAIQELAETLA